MKLLFVAAVLGMISLGVHAEDGLLARALSCDLARSEVNNLLGELAATQPEFSKATKEYALPSMNLYTLSEATSAYGHQSKEIVVMPGRIMLAVDGAALDEVVKVQELIPDPNSPASKVVGDDKAIIAYQARQKGLESKVLIGCEYRMPEAAWPIGGSADDLEAIMTLGQ